MPSASRSKANILEGARMARVVTPAGTDSSSGTRLDPIPRALFIGGAGDLACILVDDEDNGGTPVTFKNLAAGSRLDIRPSYILAATTATNILTLE